MKINNFGPSGVNPYNRQQHKVDSAKISSAKATDKIEISATAKELQQTSQIPAQRQAKVDELKAQYEAGNYKMNAEDTAKSILDYYSKDK
ncbi:flagellar biosynthesis anti-sigma factor FlgM [Peribacillus loiseleuriae]|uniref:flagellar biosynthesis anti-sigma factor FlgM n=1 Tax=Peribacillus loiseleuriae TaxID=1679170 RepID=UPI003D04CB93